MAYQLDVDEEARIVHIRLLGRHDINTVWGAVREMELRGVRDFHQLWDASGLEELVLDTPDLRGLAKDTIVREHRRRGKIGKTAAVVRRRTDRMIADLAQLWARMKGVPMKVFDTAEDARAWLLEETGTDAK